MRAGPHMLRVAARPPTVQHVAVRVEVGARDARVAQGDGIAGLRNLHRPVLWVPSRRPAGRRAARAGPTCAPQHRQASRPRPASRLIAILRRATVWGASSSFWRAGEGSGTFAASQNAMWCASPAGRATCVRHER